MGIEVTEAIYNLDLSACLLKPIKMDWPAHWQVEEQPKSNVFTMLLLKPPGCDWVTVTIDVSVKNSIDLRIGPVGILQHWQVGHIVQNLITTFAHKFAARAWHGIEPT